MTSSGEQHQISSALNTLRISEFPGLTAAAGDLVFLVQLDGRIVDYAAHLPELLYVPPDRFLSRTLKEVLPLEIADRAMGALERAHRTGELQQIVYSHPDHAQFGESCFEARVAAHDHNTIAVVIRDVSEYRRVDTIMRRQNLMLAAITRGLSRAITHENPQAIFQDLLTDIISLTESTIGFVSSLEEDNEKNPYLRTLAISDISWDEETRRLVAANRNTGLAFRNLTSLFGAVISTRQVVISQNPESDPRRGGLPSGHPRLTSFMGMPIFNGGDFVGVIGVADRPKGYRPEDAEVLVPLLNACGYMISSMRAESRRQQSEQMLRESEERFSTSCNGIQRGHLGL